MKKVLLACVGIAAIAVLILYMSGFFTRDRITPGAPAPETRAPYQPAGEARALTSTVTETYEAVGTIRPRTETKIESQVTGKVLKVRVKPGDAVNKGDNLVILEDREFAAQLGRARQGLDSARAAREEARQMVNVAKAAFVKSRLQYKRLEKLYLDKAISSREKEQAEAEYLASDARLKQAREGLARAEAGVRQAQKVVEGAQITQNYTVIQAPENAEVVKRLVEPGDLAVPGKPLLILQTAGALRLEAFVPERLISRIRPGSEMGVFIDALEKNVQGIVEEVVPSADPKTRTFLIKVGLPSVLGAYPGMFGRLLIPAGKRVTVLIPAAAVRRVGQLETVMVKEGNAWRTIYVKIGQAHGDKVEVLSGLQGNEIVALLGKSHG